MLVSRTFALRCMPRLIIVGSSLLTEIPLIHRTNGSSINTVNATIPIANVRTSANPLTTDQFNSLNIDTFGGTNVKLASDRGYMSRTLTDSAIIYETSDLVINPGEAIDNYVFIVWGTTSNGVASQMVMELTRDELVAGGMLLDAENKTIQAQKFRFSHTTEQPY